MQYCRKMVYSGIYETVKILLKILFEVFVFLCPFYLIFPFLQLHSPPCA